MGISHQSSGLLFKLGLDGTVIHTEARPTIVVQSQR